MKEEVAPFLSFSRSQGFAPMGSPDLRSATLRSQWTAAAVLATTMLAAAAPWSASTAAGPPEAVESLVTALGRGDVRERRYAAWTLGRMGTSADLAVPALVVAIDSDDALVRRYATDALAAVGPAAVDPLLGLLSRGPRSRLHAETALSRMGPAAVPAITTTLKEASDPRVRRSAATVIGAIGPGAEAAIPALLRALVTEHERSVGVELARALGRMGEAAAPPLAEILDGDPAPETREFVIRALEEMGPAARPSVPRLIDAAEHDAERRVRSRAVHALGAIGGEDVRAVLKRRLRTDPSEIVRGDAALALGRAAAGDSTVALTLVAAFAQGSPSVAAKAGMALGEIGETAIPVVTEALRHPDPNVRAYSAEALRYLASDPDLVIPPLVDALADSKERVQKKASVSLQMMGEPAVVPLLAALSTRPEGEVRAWAALTLGNVEPLPEHAVEALAVALDDESVKVREIASWALGKIGEPASAAVPALMRALDHSDPVLRRNAAWALGNVGAEAEAAESALEARLEDVDPDVREEAAEALDKIRGRYEYPGGRGVTP
jgi:HEAT repeat protein